MILQLILWQWIACKYASRFLTVPFMTWSYFTEVVLQYDWLSLLTRNNRSDVFYQLKIRFSCVPVHGHNHINIEVWWVANRLPMTTEPHIYKPSLTGHMPFFEGKGVWKLASHLTMKQSVHMIKYCTVIGLAHTVQCSATNCCYSLKKEKVWLVRLLKKHGLTFWYWDQQSPDSHTTHPLLILSSMSLLPLWAGRWIWLQMLGRSRIKYNSCAQHKQESSHKLPRSVLVLDPRMRTQGGCRGGEGQIHKTH